MASIKVVVVNPQLLDWPLIELFEASGFAVEQVQQLPDIARILAQHPEILIVDTAVLPLNLLLALRATITYTVIVVFSSHDDLDLKINYLNAGADAYFERPVSPSVVLAHIVSLLRRKTDINTDFITHLLKPAPLQTDEKPAPPLSRLQKALHCLQKNLRA